MSADTRKAELALSIITFFHISSRDDEEHIVNKTQRLFTIQLLKAAIKQWIAMNKSKAILLGFGFYFIFPELVFSKGQSRDTQRKGSLILRSCKKKCMATDQGIILCLTCFLTLRRVALKCCSRPWSRLHRLHNKKVGNPEKVDPKSKSLRPEGPLAHPSACGRIDLIIL